MPVRRGSATAHNPGGPSTRAHRSNGSTHSVLGQAPYVSTQSLPSTAGPVTPQQKVVYILVNRLKNKLPCNSGATLTELEEDDATQQAIEMLVDLSRDSLDIIAWALTEQLEKVSKQTDPNGYRTVDVLQSQLFILKVLSITMASRWGRRSEDGQTRTPKGSTGPGPMSSMPDSPGLSGRTRRNRQPSSENSNTWSPWVEPPALDDNGARYILSVMVLLLRQAAPPQQNRLMSAANRNFDASYHDYESIESVDTSSPTELHTGSAFSAVPRTIDRTHPSSASLNSSAPSSTGVVPLAQHTVTYEKTSTIICNSMLSLSSLIAKFSGRIVYHLSASNWPVVFHRIRTKIWSLANPAGDDPDIIDLNLLTHCALDRTRLIQSLQELCSLLVNMKREAQAATAIPLRTAVWNWIELYHEEFNDALLYHRRLEGAPERVFDMLYDACEAPARASFWPALTVLMCISSDRIKAEFNSVNSVGVPRVVHGRKDRNLIEHIFRALNQGKGWELGLICALDICRAASRVRPGDVETPLQSLASEIAHEIKSVLGKWGGTQKPFWECPDDIDVALVGDALVTCFRFLSEEETIAMFLHCLEPDKSDAVKICVMKAILTLIVEAPRLPWQSSLEKLREAMSTRMYPLLKAAMTRRSEVDANGIGKKPALRPKAKRYTSETVPDRELLCLSILTAWRADVMWFLAALDTTMDSIWTPETIEIWHAPGDTSVKMSLSRTTRDLHEAVMRLRLTHPHREAAALWSASAGPASLGSVCMNLIYARTDFRAQRMWMSMAHELMLRYTRPVLDHNRVIQLAPQRVPAFATAEIAFLVSLTSADRTVSAQAAQGLRLIALAERQPNAPLPRLSSEDERVKRYPVYEQLGDPKSVILGRVAHQKRIRKLIRLIAAPSAVHVAVWQECYWRWCALTEMTLRSSLESMTGGDSENGTLPTGEYKLTMEERQAQWQNLTLFMAAFGSASTREKHNAGSLTSMIPPYYLPDHLRALRDPSELLTEFLMELINLLVSDSAQARDVAREALGNELSPRLYARIVKELDQILRPVVEGTTADWEHLSVFLDQFMAIIKVLAENVQSVEEMRGIDFGNTLITLANLIMRFHDQAAYRLKMKYCALCDSVLDRADSLAVRKDSNIRQSVVDFVIEWAQDPATFQDPDVARTQREVNISVLRTAVKLFDRLELRTSDGNAGDDSNHVVSRLFIRYTNFLIRVWECSRTESAGQDDGASDQTSYSHMRATQQDGEVKELTISGLAFLISANTEFGVKHCLPLAYDEDVMKRTIFANVFARVLSQGIQFQPQQAPPVVSRQSPLCELIKGSDTTLALVICEVCPPAEVDQIISVLLNVFDTRTSLMNLLKTMIDKEIARTESDTALFRSNSTCTRFLSAFAKIYGYNYLRSLIIPLIKTMTSMPPGHSYDLDPTKVASHDLAQNQKNVQLVTSSFLEIISSSVPAFPSMFREVCAHIAKAVNEVWPESKFAALGAFIFLRFISPAVVAPEIVDVDVPRNDVIRRGLKIIAKIIQNLANNIFFGKEAHMVCLNDFLKANIVNVTRFLSDINKHTPPGPDEEQDEWLDTTYDETDTAVLHRFLEKHADKVGKELLSASKPSAEAISGKVSWNAICGALVETEQPLGSPRLQSLNSREHPEYLDLMARHAHRDTTPVHHLFVEAITPKDHAAVFVFSVAKIDVEVLDVELLLFYIFKILTSPSYEDKLFDLVLDWTSFSPSSQLPAQWVKFAHEVIPVDVRERFRHMHLLTPNALALRYMRRLYNLANGAPLAEEYFPHVSVQELLQEYPEGTSMPSLMYAVAQEAEVRETYDEVTMRHAHPMRVPVVVQVALSHLRVTTMKAQSICSTLSCRATEIIPLPDISDVYNVSTGHDSHEFIIRKIRHGSTLYFSSPARDSIVKTVRAAKGTMRNVQISGAERFSRLSNVVATLLHISTLNISRPDDELRGAAFELFCSVCGYLDFEGMPSVPSKSVFIPTNPGPYITHINEKLAAFAPHLTLDYLTEASAGLDKTTMSQKIDCLHYMSPWVKNLTHFADPVHRLYEHSGAKLRDCVRVLIDLSMADPQIFGVVQKAIWFEIGRLDSQVVNIVLDELMRAAVDGGIGSQRCEVITSIMTAVTSINVRGRIFARIRKVLGKTSTKPTKSLSENVHWNELACLTRLALVANYGPRNVIHCQLYVPELAHLVTLMAATGQLLIRTSVYNLVTSLLHAVHAAKAGDPNANPDLQLLVEESTQPETLRLFGIMRPTPASDIAIYDHPSDKMYIDALEGLTRYLGRIMEAVAGNRGMLNVWRARWMSLVTSSAFQLSPAVQTRAFVALGILATSDVDDDLLYQMLVAFKTALFQSNESDTTSILSMLRCICRIIPALPANSRYLSQLFWLAVSLLQSSHIAIYVEAIQLLQATLECMAEQGAFKQKGVAATLLEARAPLEEIAGQLDQLLGLSFESNFSFSLASIIFKGIRHSGLRDYASGALRSLLRITVQSCSEPEHGADAGAPICQDILGYFIALLPLSGTRSAYQGLLQDADINASGLSANSLAGEIDDDRVTVVPFVLLGVNDPTVALFVTSFICAMLATAQGDDTETEMLYNVLSDVANAYPDVISVMFDNLQDKIKDTFTNSSNTAILSAVSNVFRVAMQDPSRALTSRASSSTLSTVDETNGVTASRSEIALGELGMHGLANSFQFLPPNRGQATKMINWISELVMRIIE